jgi:hypothetical protein
VFISGQKRGVFGVIKRELRRRSAVEAVIGHLKTDGHLGRNFLKGYAGDHANAVLLRRRLQLPSDPCVAQATFAPDPAMDRFHQPKPRDNSEAPIRFLTVD